MFELIATKDLKAGDVIVDYHPFSYVLTPAGRPNFEAYEERMEEHKLYMVGEITDIEYVPGNQYVTATNYKGYRYNLLLQREFILIKNRNDE